MKKIVLNIEPLDYSKRAIKLWEQNGYIYKPASFDAIKTLDFKNNVEVLIVRLAHFIDKKIIDNFPNLKFIISATTGWDHLDVDYIKQKGIELITLREHIAFLENITSTAELTLALLLSLYRKIVPAFQSVKEGIWDRDQFKSYQLKGKKLGILGLGRIGKMMARYGKALGMEIHFYDPKVYDQNYIRHNTAESLVNVVDFLSIHIPATKENNKFINKKLIEAFKPGIVIVNTSRASIWDERELVEAFKKGRIGGIATDVISGEPDQIKSSPLWQVRDNNNVIITPHIGGASFDAMWETEEFLVRKVLEIK